MSETKTESKKGRRAARAAEEGSAKTESAATTFQVVASGENVVMVNTATGQTWAMTTDGSRPVWHPVTFEGGATRAPRRAKTKEAAAAT